MEQERAHPPAYTQHDPASLDLPSVPTHTLPSLRSLDLPDAQPSRASVEVSPKTNITQWGALPPLSSATFPRVPEGDVGSPMAMDLDRASVVSGEERRREMSVVSMDDPDVRLAAEALSGLGNPGNYLSVRTESDGSNGCHCCRVDAGGVSSSLRIRGRRGIESWGGTRLHCANTNIV